MNWRDALSHPDHNETMSIDGAISRAPTSLRVTLVGTLARCSHVDVEIDGARLSSVEAVTVLGAPSDDRLLSSERIEPRATFDQARWVGIWVRLPAQGGIIEQVDEEPERPTRWMSDADLSEMERHAARIERQPGSADILHLCAEIRAMREALSGYGMSINDLGRRAF